MTLYQETLCEHGSDEPHHWDDNGKLCTCESMSACPGGSREEVIIDYEAAARRWYEDISCLAGKHGSIGVLDWDDLEDDERQEEWVDEMRPYINAALGIELSNHELF